MTPRTYNIEGEELTANQVVEKAYVLGKRAVSVHTIRKRLLTDGRRTWEALSKSGAAALRETRVRYATSHAEFFKNDQKKRQEAAANEAKRKAAQSAAQKRYEKAQGELEALRQKCQAEAEKQRTLSATAQPAVRPDQTG